MTQDVLAEIDGQRSRFVEELKALLRIPSVSTDPAHAADVRRAAEHVRSHLEAIGFRAALHETPRHPLVFAEWLKAPGKPTLLVYGHFDVQPVDPIDQWVTPPFEPTQRDGNLHARGASDDKGQVFTYVKAAEAWLKTRGELPINVKFLIEGEEEIGSPNLKPWIMAHRDLVAADVVAISDTSQFAPGLPSLCTGLRGIASFELRVKTGESDLHSGSFGGAVPNAIHVLTGIVQALHNADGSIAVPGIYDDVAEPSAEEKRSWAALPHSDEAFLKTAGVKILKGEPGRSSLERIWSRPTLEIVGIAGGYQGPGHKGVVPCRATAKFSTRLVPKMRPERVIECLKRRIRELTPAGVEVELEHGHGAPPVSIPTDSQWVAAARRALAQGFGREPVFIREGGSIPIVTLFVEELHIPCLLLGYGLPDDRIHGPNEKFSLSDFHAGIRSGATLLEEIAAT
jgi:acetylornithine deacetylase/succinyl-diaminopimelate desuccinylase-like protein